MRNHRNNHWFYPSTWFILIRVVVHLNLSQEDWIWGENTPRMDCQSVKEIHVDLQLIWNHQPGGIQHEHKKKKKKKKKQKFRQTITCMAFADTLFQSHIQKRFEVKQKWMYSMNELQYFYSQHHIPLCKSYYFCNLFLFIFEQVRIKYISILTHDLSVIEFFKNNFPQLSLYDIYQFGGECYHMLPCNNTLIQWRHLFLNAVHAKCLEKSINCSVLFKWANTCSWLTSVSLIDRIILPTNCAFLDAQPWTAVPSMEYKLLVLESCRLWEHKSFLEHLITTNSIS